MKWKCHGSGNHGVKAAERLRGDFLHFHHCISHKFLVIGEFNMNEFLTIEEKPSRGYCKYCGNKISKYGEICGKCSAKLRVIRKMKTILNRIKRGDYN